MTRAGLGTPATAAALQVLLPPFLHSNAVVRPAVVTLRAALYGVLCIAGCFTTRNCSASKRGKVDSGVLVLALEEVTCTKQPQQ